MLKFLGIKGIGMDTLFSKIAREIPILEQVLF